MNDYLLYLHYLVIYCRIVLDEFTQNIKILIQNSKMWIRGFGYGVLRSVSSFWASWVKLCNYCYTYSRSAEASNEVWGNYERYSIECGKGKSFSHVRTLSSLNWFYRLPTTLVVGYEFDHQSGTKIAHGINEGNSSLSTMKRD